MTPPASPRWPKPIGSPVLESLRPVIEASEHVRTDVDRISEVASWMAYEKLPFPQFGLDFDPATDRERAIDFTMASARPDAPRSRTVRPT